ncbi:C4-dicarboxylate ABC transporter permease [Rubrivivax sp. A210]|uniref:TRAP transporter large permease n=1 Tax=Rubrivivax sp. A210 TaxID=2772301 RepID=UPI0019196A08|nr:TRAP transporter large permease [Rubrivivax sp. A210]CAD5375014.1 C4-dicarboxylate ABC transporter permease [Rubrivivax sp. A210]
MTAGPWAGALAFALVLLLILLQVPVAVAMGLVGLIAITLADGWGAAGFMLGRAAFDAAFPYALSVVPLFVAMGVLAARGGLGRALYTLVASLLGHYRGGLAHATIGACAAFGAICGSSIATAATMGRIALPEMRSRGYADTLAAASVVAGGTLGVMIPPSIFFALYGVLTGQSIGQLFLAGVLPGLLGTVLYMLAVAWSVWRRPESGPAGPRHSRAERLAALRRVWPVLLLFGLVIGGITLGWFSPTEAAAVGVVGALALTGRTMPRTEWRAALAEIALTTGMIFTLLMGANLFNYFIESTRLTDGLIAGVAALGLNRWAVIALLMLFYIVLGALMDEISMILLTVAPAYALVTGLGFDPIWFGVMLVTVCEIGMIVPPVGMNLFVVQRVTGLSMGTVVSGVAPFAVADCARLVLLCLLPGLATWLPHALS